jgi:hypothetical protein
MEVRRHGLYVVGWFLCEQWDANDYRRAEARRQLPPSLAEAQALFATQAAELSGGMRRAAAVVLDAVLR